MNAIYELNDAELDAVAAGAPAIIGQGGLINAGVIVQAEDVLNNALRNADVLSNNRTEVAVAVLGVAVT